MDISNQEAAKSWVDNVYSPVVEAIKRTGILKDFPGRSETDLYLWLKKHQVELTDRWGTNPDDELVARDLSKKFSPKMIKVLGRMFDLYFSWLFRLKSRIKNNN